MRCERGLDDGRCKWPEAGVIDVIIVQDRGTGFVVHGWFLSVVGGLDGVLKCDNRIRIRVNHASLFALSHQNIRQEAKY